MNILDYMIFDNTGILVIRSVGFNLVIDILRFAPMRRFLHVLIHFFRADLKTYPKVSQICHFIIIVKV